MAGHVEHADLPRSHPSGWQHWPSARSAESSTHSSSISSKRWKAKVTLGMSLSSYSGRQGTCIVPVTLVTLITHLVLGNVRTQIGSSSRLFAQHAAAIGNPIMSLYSQGVQPGRRSYPLIRRWRMQASTAVRRPQPHRMGPIAQLASCLQDSSLESLDAPL